MITTMLRMRKYTEEFDFQRTGNVAYWQENIFKSADYLPKINFMSSKDITLGTPTFKLLKLDKNKLSQDKIVVLETTVLDITWLTIELDSETQRYKCYLNDNYGFDLNYDLDEVYQLQVDFDTVDIWTSEPFYQTDFDEAIPEFITITTNQTVLQTVGINLTFATGNLYVDWGDGSALQDFTSGVELTKNYSSTGTYDIKIYGDLKKVTSMVADNSKFTELPDIEKLENIQTLDLRSNLITSISDLNQLDSIVSLRLDNNDITGSIELTNKTSLVLAYFLNNDLTSINLSGCTSLLTGGGNNFNGNTNLTTLNISGCTSYVSLSAAYLSLTTLNVTGCTALTTITANNNSITALNITTCTALTTLTLNTNNLTTIDFSGSANLQYCDLTSNDLTSVSNQSSLNSIIELRFTNNDLTGSFALTNKSTLTLIYFLNNDLTSIDLSNNVNMLGYGGNNFNGNSNLTTINLTGCTSFTNLTAISLSLTTLTLTGCTSLTHLIVNNNALGNITHPVAPYNVGGIIEKDNNMTSTEVDNNLIDINNTGVSSISIDIAGSNAARTSASDAAVTALLGRGCTVTAN